MGKKKDLKHWIPFVRKPEKDDICIAFITVVVLILGQLVFLCIRDCQFIGWEKIWDIVEDEIWQDIVLGLVITAAWHTIKTHRKLRNDKVFLDQLKSSVDKVLSAVENNSANWHNAQERKQNMFYLTEIINNQINIGVFQPDNLLINQVDKCESIISITESPIALWLDPTYLFFLMVQAINNITKNVPTEDISYTLPVKKQFLGRTENVTFYTETLKMVGSLKEMDENASNKKETMANVFGKKDVRIYFMTVEEITQNKGLLEWFIAVHDFAGIHLLIVDKKVLRDEKIRDPYEKIRKKMFLNDGESLDVAFRFYNDSLKYARRNNNQLHDECLGDEESFTGVLLSFLKVLTSHISENNILFPNSYGKFNQDAYGGLDSIIYNESKTRLLITKK